MVALAIDTGIPPSVWWAEDERDLITAMAILHEASEQNKPQGKGRVVAGG